MAYRCGCLTHSILVISPLDVSGVPLTTKEETVVARNVLSDDRCGGENDSWYELRSVVPTPQRKKCVV